MDGNDTWRREVRKQDSAEAGKLNRAVEPSFSKILQGRYTCSAAKRPIVLCSLHWLLVTTEVVFSEGDSLTLRAILWSG